MSFWWREFDFSSYLLSFGLSVHNTYTFNVPWLWGYEFFAKYFVFFRIILIFIAKFSFYFFAKFSHYFFAKFSHYFFAKHAKFSRNNFSFSLETLGPTLNEREKTGKIRICCVGVNPVYLLLVDFLVSILTFFFWEIFFNLFTHNFSSILHINK